MQDLRPNCPTTVSARPAPPAGPPPRPAPSTSPGDTPMNLIKELGPARSHWYLALARHKWLYKCQTAAARAEVEVEGPPADVRGSDRWVAWGPGDGLVLRPAGARIAAFPPHSTTIGASRTSQGRPTGTDNQ